MTQRLSTEQAAHRPGDYATATDLARIYGVALGTIYRWASQDQWDRTRYRPIRYRHSDAERSYLRRHTDNVNAA
ncbi:hypothetical protein GCM10010182_67470 [Actinomadura cremea]|nr:hypothetical protein GCM10010182_67470 [Actinomadura cremea]